MAIEEILVAITNQSHEEIAKILADGESKAQSIIDDAQSYAQRELERYVNEAATKAELKAVRQVRAAHLKNGRACSDIRLKNYEKLKEMTAKRLSELRDCPEYPEIFERLIRDIIFGLGENPIVLIDPRDEALTKEILKSDDLAALNATLRTTLSTLGGIKACSKDERILRDNTFESRLARLYDEHVAKIWAVLEG